MYKCNYNVRIIISTAVVCNVHDGCIKIMIIIIMFGVMVVLILSVIFYNIFISICVFVKAVVIMITVINIIAIIVGNEC